VRVMRLITSQLAPSQAMPVVMKRITSSVEIAMSPMKTVSVAVAGHLGPSTDSILIQLVSAGGCPF